MARKPRSNICGGIYHVMNRGNRKMRIFEDVQDRRTFFSILLEEKETHSVALHAGCEMDNHFHLAIGTPNGNLSEFMGRLQGRFARYYNRRHGTVGHLFQGRFRDVLIEHDAHLLIALCYLFLNPVSARLVVRPEDYRWSTYAATVGAAPLPDYLSIDWLTTLFDGHSFEEAQRRLRGLMAEAKPIDAYLQDELSVDPDAVRRVLRSFVGEQWRLATLPRLYRTALRSKLSDLVQVGMTPQARVLAIYEAHVEHGYTLSEIARELRLDQSTVSKIFRSIYKSRSSAAA